MGKPPHFGSTNFVSVPPTRAFGSESSGPPSPARCGSDHLLESEAGLGLLYGLQLDVYEDLERVTTGTFRHEGNRVELRYALADWRKIRP